MYYEKKIGEIQRINKGSERRLVQNTFEWNDCK
jgi:hypothetical protein